MSLYYGTAYGYDMLEVVGLLALVLVPGFRVILLSQQINQEIMYI